MLDYRLSKMCYDLHTDRALADEYRAERLAVIARYQLADEVAQALCNDDVAFLARRTNGFLLRYYFLVVGMSEANFIAGLQANREPVHG
jgi:hypothetical protein